MVLELTLVWPNEKALCLKFVSSDKIDKLTNFHWICFYALLLCTARKKNQASRLVLLEALLYKGKDMCDKLSNQLFKTVSKF